MSTSEIGRPNLLESSLAEQIRWAQGKWASKCGKQSIRWIYVSEIPKLRVRASTTHFAISSRLIWRKSKTYSCFWIILHFKFHWESPPFQRLRIRCYHGNISFVQAGKSPDWKLRWQLPNSIFLTYGMPGEKIKSNLKSLNRDWVSTELQDDSRWLKLEATTLTWSRALRWAVTSAWCRLHDAAPTGTYTIVKSQLASNLDQNFFFILFLLHPSIEIWDWVTISQ